jgi:hypothetical protein
MIQNYCFMQKRISLIVTICILSTFSLDAQVSQHTKKRVPSQQYEETEEVCPDNKKLVAYDHQNNIIDSLVKNLNDQCSFSRFIENKQLKLLRMEKALHIIDTSMYNRVLNRKSRKEIRSMIISINSDMHLLIEDIEKHLQLLTEMEKDSPYEFFLIVDVARDYYHAKRSYQELKKMGFEDIVIYHHEGRDIYYISVNRYRDYLSASYQRRDMTSLGVNCWVYCWGNRK